MTTIEYFTRISVSYFNGYFLVSNTSVWADTWRGLAKSYWWGGDCFGERG